MLPDIYTFVYPCCSTLLLCIIRIYFDVLLLLFFLSAGVTSRNLKFWLKEKPTVRETSLHGNIIVLPCSLMDEMQERNFPLGPSDYSGDNMYIGWPNGLLPWFDFILSILLSLLMWTKNKVFIVHGRLSIIYTTTQHCIVSIHYTEYDTMINAVSC